MKHTSPESVVAADYDLKLLPRDLDGIAGLVEEAADILERMPREVFDAMEIRYFLCDELGGSAVMMRRAALMLRKENEE